MMNGAGLAPGCIAGLEASGGGRIMGKETSVHNARHFTIYFVYFSSCKTTPLSAAGNTLINTTGRLKLSYFKDFLVCYKIK